MLKEGSEYGEGKRGRWRWWGHARGLLERPCINMRGQKKDEGKAKGSDVVSRPRGMLCGTDQVTGEL